MLKTFLCLLGADAPVMHRYLRMAVFLGLLSGSTTVLLVPVFTCLFARDLAATAAWLVALLAAMTACWALRRRVEKAGVAVGVAILQGARHRVADHVAGLPLGWFTPTNTTRVGHLLTQGMMAVAQLPAHVLTPVITGAVAPVVLVLALLAIHPALGLIALFALPVLAGVAWLTLRMGRRADQAFHRRFADASQRMVEFAQAQPVLRAFPGGGAATRFLDDALGEQRRAGTRLVCLSAGSALLNAWAIQTVFAGMVLVALLWLDSGAATGPAVLALLLVRRFIDPLLDVASYGEILRGAGAQLEAVRNILREAPLPQPAHPVAPHDASIELRGVNFRYAADEAEVLHGIDLRIEPGSMTAVIGASGSGKTSLVRLIARFFDVTQGEMRVGGVDVRTMTSEQLGAQIGQIFQDSALLAGSIADNIRAGRPAATDAELLQAAEQAGLAGFVARLPQGLDTPVGEAGVRLSGGERQRIAIARALIKDAPILLVDEATAALDAENQAVIAQTLARLRGRRTVVVIAHQLSTVAMADRIVVLEAGRISEIGSPERLRASGGRYADFLAHRLAAKGWRLAPRPQH